MTNEAYTLLTDHLDANYGEPTDTDDVWVTSGGLFIFGAEFPGYLPESLTIARRLPPTEGPGPWSFEPIGEADSVIALVAIVAQA